MSSCVSPVLIYIACDKHLSPRQWTHKYSLHYITIVICCLWYWYCQRTQSQETRSPACVTNAAPENPNMLHTRVGAIGTDKYSVPGWETVGIQDPVGTQCKVLSNDIQCAFATALLDQLEDYGADVREHHRRLRTRQDPAKPQIEAKPSLEIEIVELWHMFPFQNSILWLQ